MASSQPASSHASHAQTKTEKQQQEQQQPPAGAAEWRKMFWAARHPPRDPLLDLDLDQPTTGTTGTTSSTPPPPPPYAGRVVLVTGANTGLGLQAALKYAALGAERLVLAVRSRDKGRAAAALIRARVPGYDDDGDGDMSSSSDDDGDKGDGRLCSSRENRKSSRRRKIVIRTVDMASFASVAAFVRRLRAEEPRLHVAMLNAGVATPAFVPSRGEGRGTDDTGAVVGGEEEEEREGKREEEGEGEGEFEIALKVNVLSTALMALGLLPKLWETAEAEAAEAGRQGAGSQRKNRPVNLCFMDSSAHLEVTADWLPEEGNTRGGAGQASHHSSSRSSSLLGRLNDRSRFDARAQYYLVKLATTFVMQKTAELCRVRNDNGDSGDSIVVVNAVCPGLCKTDLGRDFSTAAKIMMVPFQALFARTAEQGSRSMVSATALGPESSGRMWVNDGYASPTEFMTSPRGKAICDEMWQETLDILSKYGGLSGDVLGR